MKPTGAEEPRRGITRSTTGGRENVPLPNVPLPTTRGGGTPDANVLPPTTGGGGTPEAAEGESSSGSNATPPREGAATLAPEQGEEGGMSSAGGASAAEGIPRMRRPLRSSMAPKIHRQTSPRSSRTVFENGSSRAGGNRQGKGGEWRFSQKRSWRSRHSSRVATTRTSGRRERENSMRWDGPKTTINRAMCWHWSLRRRKN